MYIIHCIQCPKSKWYNCWRQIDSSDEITVDIISCRLSCTTWQATGYVLSDFLT